jgi:MoaA/NifB/PqqE/SkfB family radical SAM enzyme
MKSGPDYIQFYPTLRCNKACAFCFNKDMPFVEDMPLADFRKMTGMLKDAGVKTLDMIGGEPTLHKDLLSMIQEAERNGFRVNLSSNGSDTEALSRVLETTKNATVGISVNDRETLAAVREFVKNHRPVVKTVFSPGLDVTLVKDILALKPKKFYLLYRDTLGPGELSSGASFDRFLATVEKQFGSSAGTVYCSGFLPDLESYPELSKTRCPAGTTKLGVMPDGSVYPCNLFFGREEFLLGNVLSSPFGRIWDHPVLTFFTPARARPAVFMGSVTADAPPTA